jgi:hypothetical protein
VACVWQEQDACHRPVRIVQPVTNGDVALRERGMKGRGVFHDTPTGGPVVREDEQAGDSLHVPTSAATDLCGEPCLSIDPVEHRLDVRHGRLDLDDEQRPAPRVKGQDVDRPAFSADFEGHFRGDLPPCRFEKSEASFDKIGVRGVEQAIETLAVPQDPNINARAQSRRHADDRVERDPVDSSALEPPDH